MKRSLAALLLVAALAPAVLADSRSAEMNVSAIVLARAVVTVDERPREVVVTDADVRRGYIELSSPLRIKVRTNARSGYLLHVVNLDSTFSAAELRTSDVMMNVLAESIIARPRVAGGDALSMTVRLILGPAARAGVYAFPIAVDAEPMS